MKNQLVTVKFPYAVPDAFLEEVERLAPATRFCFSVLPRNGRRGVLRLNASLRHMWTVCPDPQRCCSACVATLHKRMSRDFRLLDVTALGVFLGQVLDQTGYRANIKVGRLLMAATRLFRKSFRLIDVGDGRLGIKPRHPRLRNLSLWSAPDFQLYRPEAFPEILDAYGGPFDLEQTFFGESAGSRSWSQRTLSQSGGSTVCFLRPAYGLDGLRLFPEYAFVEQELLHSGAGRDAERKKLLSMLPRSWRSAGGPLLLRTAEEFRRFGVPCPIDCRNSLAHAEAALTAMRIATPAPEEKGEENNEPKTRRIMF